jgi:hypothetical protein
MSWPVLARCGGNMEKLSGNAKLLLFPVCEAMDARAWSEIPCAILRGNNMTAIEKLTTKIIEIVGMVLVTEKYGIDMGKLVHLDCWVVMDLEWRLPG